MKKCWLLLLIFPAIVHAQKNIKMETTLDSMFQSYFRVDEPGGAVLVIQKNKIIYQKGFGLADMQTKEKIGSSTIFNLGSISKTFVALGILKLAEEGKLTLSDPISNFFPDFVNKTIADQVKVFHLLTHSSGLPDSRKVKEQREFYLTAKDEENFAPLKATAKLEFEPGTRYKYSNPAFNGLALIIEKVSGIKWQDYIANIIFRPAGMSTSTITDGPHPASGVAHAYVKNKDGKFDELDYGEEPTFAASGNGGVWSSVDELWKYEKAIQDYSILGKKWTRLSREIYSMPLWKDSAASRLGLSWFITQEAGVGMIGHTGSQGGFISDYCWLPHEKIFYVLLCNIPKPIKEIRMKLFSIMGLGKR